MEISDSFIPYGRQHIDESDKRAVLEALDSPFLTQGTKVPEFEKAVTSKVGSEDAVAVNSATSALHIACMALGLERGDRLWTSPTTFVASANCARYCGAEVDFVDIDGKSGLMSITSLEKKLEKAEHDGELPKIVIPVHLCGTSCDTQAIAQLAQKYDFNVIEDASHAIGGKYKNENIGCCKYSSISVFSFHPVKIITTAEGGMATTNNTEIAKVMRNLRSHGITKDSNHFMNKSTGQWYYEQQTLGFNYRMNDLQAALGISQLKRLDQIVKERQRLYKRYEKLLKELPVSLLDIPNEVISSLHLAVIRLNNSSHTLHQKVFRGLRENGIGVQLHYMPVHLQPYYRNLGFREGDFPEAEAYAQNAISLPIFPGLKEKEQERIVQILADLVNE